MFRLQPGKREKLLLVHLQPSVFSVLLLEHLWRLVGGDLRLKMFLLHNVPALPLICTSSRTKKLLLLHKARKMQERAATKQQSWQPPWPASRPLQLRRRS